MWELGGGGIGGNFCSHLLLEIQSKVWRKGWMDLSPREPTLKSWFYFVCFFMIVFLGDGKIVLFEGWEWRNEGEVGDSIARGDDLKSSRKKDARIFFSQQPKQPHQSLLATPSPQRMVEEEGGGEYSLEEEVLRPLPSWCWTTWGFWTHPLLCLFLWFYHVIYLEYL